MFDRHANQIAIFIPIYGFVASVLPVWLLLERGQTRPTGPTRRTALARLAQVWGLAALVILLTTISYLYYALLLSLEEEDRLYLVKKIQVVRTVLQNSPDNPAEVQREIQLQGEYQFIRFYIRVLDGQGPLVAGFPTPGERIEAALVDEGPVSLLTPREREMLFLIGQGLSNREIAESLVLSIKTVEAHREHIKKKLRLTNTTELVRHAIHWVEYQRTAVT